MVLGHRVQGPREWQSVWNDVKGTVTITCKFLLKRLYVNSLEVLPCQTGPSVLQLPNNRIDGFARAWFDFIVDGKQSRASVFVRNVENALHAFPAPQKDIGNRDSAEPDKHIFFDFVLAIGYSTFRRYALDSIISRSAVAIEKENTPLEDEEKEAFSLWHGLCR